MPGINLEELSISELLKLHSDALHELQSRNVLRTQNNPTGDYGEWLFAEKLGLKLEGNSAKGYDATDANGVRYQIKSRRVTKKNPIRQLGVLRGLEAEQFDYLLAVIFDESWKVSLAVKIPHAAIAGMSTYRAYQNGNVLTLSPSLFKYSTVENITHMLA